MNIECNNRYPLFLPKIVVSRDQSPQWTALPEFPPNIPIHYFCNLNSKHPILPKTNHFELKLLRNTAFHFRYPSASQPVTTTLSILFPLATGFHIMTFPPYRAVWLFISGIEITLPINTTAANIPTNYNFFMCPPFFSYICKITIEHYYYQINL